jgi:hypothetical protein
VNEAEFEMLYGCSLLFANIRASTSPNARLKDEEFDLHVFLYAARASSPPPPRPPLKRRARWNRGGSCDPTTWRADAALPQLSEKGITCYNPQTSNWHPG